jgi:hypothetical protein
MLHNLIPVLVIFLLPFAVYAQSTEAILHKHAEAMGGLERWQNLQSYQQTFTKENGTELIITCLMPNKITLHFTRGDSEMIKAYDGQHGYILNDGNYQAMRPGEAVEMAEEPHFYSDLMMAMASGTVVEQLEDESIEGIPCYKFKLSKHPKDVQLYWLNKETFLIEQTGEFSEDSAHQGIYYKTRLKDYRPVDGYVFPFEQALIPSDRPAIVSRTSRIRVNFPANAKQFEYQPDNTRNLLAYWQDRYAATSLRAFTFDQITIRFKEEVATDTSLWHEAVQYPDQFRIDFGDGREGNINLWRNDSLYVLRDGAISHHDKKIQESLLMKGALYHLPPDSLIARFQAVGIEHTVFHKSTYQGRQAYIIGASPQENDRPQIWVDAERRNVVKRVSKLPNGKVLEVQYGDFLQLKGHWVESWVAFYLDDQLIQTERYKNIDVQPTLEEGTFHPTRFKESFWY